MDHTMDSLDLTAKDTWCKVTIQLGGGQHEKQDKQGEQ